MDAPDPLYPFSYYDDLRRRWLRARYKASLKDIQARYPQYRLEGEPEIRGQSMGQFMPPGRE